MGKMSTRQVFAPAVKHQIAVATSVTVFLDAGLYHGVDWENGVHVSSNASLRTVVSAAQIYLAGLGGGSIFLNLIGTHVFAPTLTVSLAGITFMALGKSTVLTVDVAAPVSFFEVEANDVTFQNIAFNAQVGAYVDPGNLDGITVQAGSHRTLLIQLYFYNWPATNDHPCEVKTVGVQREVVVAECNFYNCRSYSLAFVSPAGGHCIAVGCTLVDSGGIEFDFGSFNFVVACSFRGLYGGISSVSVYESLCFVVGCSFNGTRSVLIDGTVGVPTNNCSVVGCTFSACIDQAITVGDYANDALISGNTITASTDRQAGVFVWQNVNRATIIGNRINCVYGVYIWDATAVDTAIFDNNFNGCTTPVYFQAGAPTVIVPTLVLPFVAGTESVTADAAPKGWRVDAANEFAITYGVMPTRCQQTLRIRVWAVGLAAPGAGNQMRIDLTANGAQPDEVYTGEAISVLSEESNETNFAVNDIVTWTFAPADDADIGHLVAGDCLEIKLIYRAAVAPDIATNALLRCVEIMYV